MQTLINKFPFADNKEHSLIYSMIPLALSNVCIWIPRGIIHSSNVLQGSGHFITLRIN